jgi:hypothetical protein
MIVDETIKQSIRAAQVIEIEYLYGLQKDDRVSNSFVNVTIHPYIYGLDIYQYTFVWAYIPFVNTFYKFLVDNIRKVTITDITYTVLPEAIYPYALEEEHYSVLLGFDKVFERQVQPIENSGKPPESSAS